MDFTLSAEQHDIARAAQKAFARWGVRSAAEGGESGYDRLAAEGWVGLALPATVGGSGMGLLEQVLVLEAAGYGLHGEYWPFVMLGALPLARCGLATGLLPALAAGEKRAVLALYEDHQRFASLEPLAQAVNRSETGDYRLVAGKVLVPGAARADYVICPVWLDGELAVLAVPAGTGELRPAPSSDLIRPHFDLVAGCAAVPREALVAKGREAVTYLQQAVAIGTVGLCAELVGAATAVLDLTVRYVCDRQQFGSPIGSFQAVKHSCADMKVIIESARSAVYYAAWAVDVGAADAERAVSVAKAYCSQHIPTVMSQGLHLHGGMGFTWEIDLHLYLRRALVDAAYLGDARWHRSLIARSLLPARTGKEDSHADALFAQG